MLAPSTERARGKKPAAGLDLDTRCPHDRASKPEVNAMLHRPRRFALALVPLFASACGGSGGTETGPGPNPTADTFEAGPFQVDGGKEIVMCTYARGTNDAEADVTLLEGTESAGGHHLIVYTVDHAIDLPPSACSQGGQPSWNQILVTQLPSESLSFPKGIGFHVKAHQQYVLETHYLNTTPDQLHVKSSFNATYAPPGTVTTRAGAYFFGSLNLDLPPNASWSKTVECSPPQAMTLHTMFGHEHRRGVGVSVMQAPGGQNPAMVYATKEWDAPPVQLFDGGHALGTSDKIRVTCDWDNTTPGRLRYPHEMCFAIGTYWPADQGTLVCASGGGKDDCNCRYTGGYDTGPGGAKVEVNVARADMVPGAGGDLASGAPVYCSMWRAQDWDGLFPKKGAQPYYLRDAVDVPLATPSDKASILFDDVTPGDYVVLCIMDAIGGGFYPGKGDVINGTQAHLHATEGQTTQTNVTLDYAVP
jgi:hypothetical protein